MPPIPDLPDHYRVWQRDDGSWWQLGRGSVFKATDRRTDQTVALRFLAAGPRTPDAMGTLAEYAARLARPGSPLVAPLRDFFVSGNFNVAATEFIDGESLAERVVRAGPLPAETAWTLACQLLESLASLHAVGIAHGSLEPSKILFPVDASDDAPCKLVEAGLHPAASVAADTVAGSGSSRDDLGRLGATLWFALTGDAFDPAPALPLPWPRLDAAGITPTLGALPVLLARTLTGDPAQRPPTAPALLAALNMLEPLRSAVPESRDMPSRAPAPDPVAPPPSALPPPIAEESELWTRTTTQLSTPNRRRRKSRQIWSSLGLLALGGIAGFFTGIAYQENRPMDGTAWDFRTLAKAIFPAGSKPTVGVPPPVAVQPPTPAPAVPPLPVSPPVSAAGTTARLERIRRLQPDVSDVLRYAREMRRVATLPVANDASFPTNALVARLLERCDWLDPASPSFHRTPLLLVLDYSNEHPNVPGQETSRQSAEAVARALVSHGMTSPIYTCGLGSAEEIPEVDSTPAAANGRFVEVWVAFTLF